MGGTLSVFNLRAFMGGVGGLFYVLVRRWLPAPSIPRAFAFVILAFLITAGGPLDQTNKDFFIFGPPTLAVALFSLPYLPYGLDTALLVNRFDRYVPPPFSSGVGTAAGALLITDLTAFGAYHTVTSIKAIV